MADANVKAAALEEKEPFFGKKERKALSDPLNDNNPITVQVLGICSALAVTTLVKPAFIMALSVIFVTAFSNLAIALLRKGIPKQIRMIVQLVVIAFLVTVVEQVLKAFNYETWKQLSVFIGLIITNCIVMGRLEAYAMANTPWRSFLDGIGNGAGYGVILLAVAVIRELFGRGSVAGFKIIGSTNEFLLNTSQISWLGWYQNNGLMVLPASAIFLIGIIIWLQRASNKKLVDVS
ncbi:MAG: NADH:ubiquinone reductase (Na(+)-transporting) subunit D [Haliscomenobacter sp.]|nr:NADH:ubiquinone reductase (Na(+)-transporting) subunit D [Haliscomenobacter sp.]MBP9076542.1 NADH:ubiquinone reductase (Na(+)-transporting) subunit D [Haliscomenobacter sp.]MBP9874203.1 NADH:ubiquinone reductase (Na(+)-transporting) subunit D [Haliscomenobacter sp.]